MTIKPRYILIISIALLTACGRIPPATETPTATQVLTTETLPPPPTLLPLSTLPPSPTMPPSPIPTPLSIPAVLPKFPLDGYVMLFTKDGDLYFQDGGNMPVRLTGFKDKSEHPPYITLLSDDNQKVVVIRKNDSNVYSATTDGTQVQIIISNDKMNSFGSGIKIGALKFIPHTHQLLFIAIQCEVQDDSPCPTSAFLANVDTGEIKKLADLGSPLTNPDFGEVGLGSLFVNPYIGEYRNIKISPDGKRLAIGTSEGMDIYTLDGNLIRDNILAFTPSTASIAYPSLFWLPDSSGLVATLPTKAFVGVGVWGGTTVYMIWRYSLNNNSAVQISLEPPAVLGDYFDYFQISPDGNWILYYGGPPESPYNLYLGDLTNKNTKAFGNVMMQLDISWSPDSEHFIVGGAVGSLDGLLNIQGLAYSWIDANHFTCVEHDFINKQDKSLIIEIKGNEIHFYELEFSYSTQMLIKPK